MNTEPRPLPLILPLGDGGLLLRFSDRLSAPANAAALAFARRVALAGVPGVVEIAPNLVSVLLRYDPARTSFGQLAGEVRLLVSAPDEPLMGEQHEIDITYDGADIDEVCASLGLDRVGFIARHGGADLCVLAIGFAPGFAYCGFHSAELHLPRRQTVRPAVPAGTVLFAAGQTAITATTVPTGWHVIGHTSLRNFRPLSEPPVSIRAGDSVRFREVT